MRAARRGNPSRGPAAGDRRGRLGQDAHADLSGRAADRERGAARRDPAADLHAAGGAGDAAPRRAIGRRSRRQVAGGTFHSFANLILRQFGGVIGLKPNFTILDRADMEDVVNLLRTRMGLGSKERRFPKKGTIAEAISMARNKNRALLADELEIDFPHLLEHQAEIAHAGGQIRGLQARARPARL